MKSGSSPPDGRPGWRQRTPAAAPHIAERANGVTGDSWGTPRWRLRQARHRPDDRIAASFAIGNAPCAGWRACAGESLWSGVGTVFAGKRKRLSRMRLKDSSIAARVRNGLRTTCMVAQMRTVAGRNSTDLAHFCGTFCMSARMCAASERTIPMKLVRCGILCTSVPRDKSLQRNIHVFTSRIFLLYFQCYDE